MKATKSRKIVQKSPKYVPQIDNNMESSIVLKSQFNIGQSDQKNDRFDLLVQIAKKTYKSNCSSRKAEGKNVIQ